MSTTDLEAPDDAAHAAAANPLEIADLRSDPEKLRPLLAGTGGAARYLGEGATPAVPRATTPRMRSMSA